MDNWSGLYHKDNVDVEGLNDGCVRPGWMISVSRSLSNEIKLKLLIDTIFVKYTVRVAIFLTELKIVMEGTNSAMILYLEKSIYALHLPMANNRSYVNIITGKASGGNLNWLVNVLYTYS